MATDPTIAVPHTTVDGDLSLFSARLYKDVYGVHTRAPGQILAYDPGQTGIKFYDAVHVAHFLDGDLLVSPTAAEAQVYRLYDAAFGRAADTDGLAYWVGQINAGVTLQATAQAFVQSPEFIATYGRLGDPQFVTAVYQNVLGRAPDAAGTAYYQTQLANGASRADVLVSLSESAEHQQAVASKLPNGGAFVVKTDAGAIEAIYDTFLARWPDKAGLASWIHEADAGTSLQQIADGFAAAPEFMQRYAGTTDPAYIQALYQNTLHRAGDAAGESYWTDQLAHGHTRAEVALGFATSPEHAALVRSHVDHGLDFF